jgi:hypothetical protein
MIPILSLQADQEPSADQIIRSANGELQILTDDGAKVGILLQRKDRLLLDTAIALGHLECSGTKTRLAEVFCAWCDAKQVPYVSFVVEKDCVDILSANDSLENRDPLVTLHFDVATARRPFSRAGLLAVTEFLIGKLWNLTLAPWKISAGVLPLSQARKIVADVRKIWDTTSDPALESGLSSDYGPGVTMPQMVQ